MPETTEPAARCVRYVGFRDDRYRNAYRIFGAMASKAWISPEAEPLQRMAPVALCRIWNTGMALVDGRAPGQARMHHRVPA